MGKSASQQAPAVRGSVDVYVRKDHNDGDARLLSFTIPSDIPQTDVFARGFAFDGNAAVVTVTRDTWLEPMIGSGSDDLHVEEVPVLRETVEKFIDHEITEADARRQLGAYPEPLSQSYLHTYAKGIRRERAGTPPDAHGRGKIGAFQIISTLDPEEQGDATTLADALREVEEMIIDWLGAYGYKVVFK